MADLKSILDLDPRLIAELVTTTLQELAAGQPAEKVKKEGLSLALKMYGHAGLQAKVAQMQRGQEDIALIRGEIQKDVIQTRGSISLQSEKIKASNRENLLKLKLEGSNEARRIAEEEKRQTYQFRQGMADAAAQSKFNVAPGSESVLKLAEQAMLRLKENIEGGEDLMSPGEFAELKKVVLAPQTMAGTSKFEADAKALEALRANRAEGAAQQATLKLREAFKDVEPPTNVLQLVQGMAKDTGKVPSDHILRLAQQHTEQQQRAFAFDAEAERVLKTHGKTAAGLGKNAAQSLPEVLAAAKNDAVSGKLDVKSAISRVETALTESAAASGKSKLGWGAAIAALMLPFLLRKKKDDQPSPQEQMALMQALESARQSSDLNTALVNSKNAIASRDQAKADLLRMQAMQLMPQAGMSGGGL